MKTFVYWCCCSVTQLCLILQPHGLEHTRLPCPSLYPRLCSNSCPLSRWCYLTILSSATFFSFHLQSFPASGSFPMGWLSASGDQNIQKFYPIAHRNFKQSYPKLETNEMPLYWLKNELAVVHPYNKILLNNKRSRLLLPETT